MSECESNVSILCCVALTASHPLLSTPPLTPPSHLQQLQVVVVFGGGEAGEGGTIDIAHGRRRLLACVEGVAVEALGTAPSLLERRATFDDLRIGHGQHVHVVDRIRLQLKRGVCVCVCVVVGVR